MLAGKAGAIDAMVAAMRAHVGNANVSNDACLAMRLICKNGVFGVGWSCVSAALSEVD